MSRCQTGARRWRTGGCVPPWCGNGLGVQAAAFYRFAAHPSTGGRGIPRFRPVNVFLGLDGGGTRTRALVVDESGRHLGRGDSEATNPRHATEAQVRMRLEESIGDACKAAGVSVRDCASAFVGMAGVTSEAGRVDMGRRVAACGLECAKIGVDHDIRVALAGGLVGKPGIALIVGTGSACYGRTEDGWTWQTGGWEWLIADEGSGFWLGREAIAAAARMADGRQSDTGLREAVFGWLGIGDITELMHRLHAPEMPRSEIAALAPALIRRAEEGDEAAGTLLKQGAELLAEMVEANHRMLPTSPGPDLVITGGVGTSASLYREVLETAITSRLPQVRIHPPILSPVAGAALLAIQQVGGSVTESWIRHVKAFDVP